MYVCIYVCLYVCVRAYIDTYARKSFYFMKVNVK